MDKYFQKSILLYGHVHNNPPDYFNQTLGSRAINVGADMIDYKHICIDEILNIIHSQENKNKE
jgi:calcineurin-like phosphoesterase family protein